MPAKKEEEFELPMPGKIVHLRKVVSPSKKVEKQREGKQESNKLSDYL